MKKGSLHREWSLWNQLILSQNQTVLNDIDNDNINGNSPFSDISVTDHYDEKHSIHSSSSSPYHSYNDDEKKYFSDKYYSFKNWKKSFIFSGYFILSLLSISFLFNFNNDNNSSLLNLKSLIHNYILKSHNSNHIDFSLSNFQDFQDFQDNNNFNSLTTSQPHEIIDIPLFPYSDISNPVYSSLLLNHTFALSWNRPISVDYYSPPSNITYNRIILTLNTSIDGVQYDRLIHIYLNDNEIWRSSTIEPSGNLSTSFTQKDVTMYSNLFNKNGSLLIQLDNLITKKLTGKFNIQINALYFNDNEIENFENDFTIEYESDEFLNSKNPFGKNISNHPNYILPLTSNKIADNIPPIVYYPDSNLSNIKLPFINYNTTKLLLLVSTSGNAAEEFWYSNLVDKYKDYFLSNDHHFYGHGSCRVINIFVNGIRIHTTNPKPYVFTGGIAPTLWNSIVSTGSFDLLPYHIDLTPVLPLLWNDPSSLLEIEISNCIDDDVKSVIKSGINSNWITSASLAIWEDENIDDSFGTFEILDNSTTIKEFAFAPPFSGFLTQIIKADYKNYLQSNITYTLKDGTQLSNLKNYESETNQTSLIFISKFADSQSCLTILKSNSTKSNIDPLTLDSLDSFSMISNNTLKSKLEFLEPKIIDDITFNVNLSVAFNTGAYSSMIPLAEIKSKENGTAEFTLSSSGNHGTGSMLHNYTLSTIDGLIYNREALTNNSVILYDNITILDSTSDSMIDLDSQIIPTSSKLDQLNFLTLEEKNELNSLLNEEEVANLIFALTNNDKKEHCH